MSSPSSLIEAGRGASSSRVVHAHTIPFGAELREDGTTQFQLWAPAQLAVWVEIAGAADSLELKRAARFIRPEDLRQAVFVATDLDEHAARLREIRELGVATLDVHNVGRNQTNSSTRSVGTCCPNSRGTDERRW